MAEGGKHKLSPIALARIEAEARARVQAEAEQHERDRRRFWRKVDQVLGKIIPNPFR